MCSPLVSSRDFHILRQRLDGHRLHNNHEEQVSLGEPWRSRMAPKNALQMWVPALASRPWHTCERLLLAATGRLSQQWRRPAAGTLLCSDIWTLELIGRRAHGLLLLSRQGAAGRTPAVAIVAPATYTQPSDLQPSGKPNAQVANGFCGCHVPHCCAQSTLRSRRLAGFPLTLAGRMRVPSPSEDWGELADDCSQAPLNPKPLAHAVNMNQGILRLGGNLSIPCMNLPLRLRAIYNWRCGLVTASQASIADRNISSIDWQQIQGDRSRLPQVTTSCLGPQEGALTFY